jgi:hypothetical protein
MLSLPKINDSLMDHESPRGGFALVIALGLMAFVLILLLSITTLVQVETRSSKIQMQQMEAEQVALLGLQIALGELQKIAGPDQRVSATASILGDASNPYTSETTAANGRKHWAGVWDTSGYSPADPDNKNFVRWLVSGDPDNLDAIADVGTTPAADAVVIFEAVNAAGALTPANDVKVEKIAISNAGSSSSESFYAYWVEDQGVKADMAWNEGEFTDDQRKQAARLSVSPGVDYEVFTGPFAGKVNYPIAKNGSNTWHDNLDKALSPADMPLVMSDTSDQSAWLKQHRHDMTFGSRGVMADVKKGGLRRDLSLAFEMDGDADITSTEQPSLFNLQDGEFVGGSDKYASTRDCPDMPVRERYLFRETRETGGPFADKIYLKTSRLENREQSVARGPTWWNLRDYYNLYKRLKASGSNYSIKARAYYPDRTTIGYSHSDMLDTIITWADHRDTDYRKPFQGRFAGEWKYIFRPARPNYAPVNLGTTSLISVMATNYDANTQMADIAIAIDPIFYLWNPYNRELVVDNVAVYFETGFPGSVRVTITDAGVENAYDVDVWQLLSDNFENNSGGRSYSFMINGKPGEGAITLAPGEVVAASPTSESGQSYLGFDPLDNSSGIIMSNLSGVPNRFSVQPGATKINIGYHKHASAGGGSSRFFMETQLAPMGTTAQDLAQSREILGNQIQSTHMQLTSARYEHIAENSAVLDTPIDLNSLLNVKKQFGLFTYLMKPAAWSGSKANPVEVFTRFNPAPMCVSKDFWAAATPNMVYNFVADQNPNNLINNNGLNFSANARNAFWGKSYDSSGSTAVPMSNIPSGPLLSLADFAHANLGTMAEDPFHAVGNSWASPVISPIAPYGTVNTGGGAQTYGTGTDLSWHSNDALFDRYYLSGIAPEFSIDSVVGYSSSGGSLNQTLKDFYGSDSSLAKANPALEPYIPEGKTAEDIVKELDPLDPDQLSLPVDERYKGYKKLGAYSLIKGAFNVNSTSVKAWEALLRGNKKLAVKYAEGGTEPVSNNDSPFPSSVAPSAPGSGAKTYWSGFSRLTDADITALATEIVDQVKIRGPFMSISDFVNRKVGGTSVTNEHQAGAIQTAINNVGINSTVQGGAGGVTSDYAKHSPLVKNTEIANGNTAKSIAMDITQADLLRPLAPRLNARTDTFRIRAYGEVKDSSGKIIAQATGEAVVQRVPEYVDSSTSAADNEAWDEHSVATPLNLINQSFGRRFKIVSFRWLDDNEV